MFPAQCMLMNMGKQALNIMRLKSRQFSIAVADKLNNIFRFFG